MYIYSYNYKARDFEPCLPEQIIICLPESGVPPCGVCATFSLYVFPEEFLSRMPFLPDLVQLVVINSCFLGSPCEVQPISALNTFSFTHKTRIQSIGKNVVVFFSLVFFFLLVY